MEKAAAMALNRIFGFKPAVSLGLMDLLGCASAAFGLSEREKEDIFGPYGGTAGMLDPGRMDEACSELERLLSDGYDFIPFTSPDYPAALKECPDAPAGLYFRSCSTAAEVFGDRASISVVGTRDISPYGSEWCSRIVCRLASSSPTPTIVSGLAFGVDVTAHLVALDNGAPTVAVLPTGIDDVYPFSHRRIADRIAGTAGCALVTDYPPGTKAQKINFLRRNRIIAGLSSCTILVESKIKGGGLMTARLASGYGRDVFVLPGRIDDPRSGGCNILLKEKIAEPVTDLSGLPGALGLKAPDPGKQAGLNAIIDRLYGQDPQERTLRDICSAVRKRRGLSFDEICRLTGLDYGTVAACAGRLESDGVISIDLAQRCVINRKYS